ncbi:MAG: hypothetical protein ACRDYU_06550 [Actinomycetes bacterium]
MAGFVQIVEYQTSRFDEVKDLGEKFRTERAAEGPGPVRRVTVTADKDRPGYYLSLIEFDSYEAAMENSKSPETMEFAAKMTELCDGPPKFFNLDVKDSWTS